MPRTPSDYSKSVIYKIEHIDNPELVYVGSTTNFINRKCKHKNACKNENNKDYNIKLYHMIREHGNWESFKIMIICEFPCNSKTELLIEEEKHRKELQASLNSIRAFRSIEEKKIHEQEYCKKYHISNQKYILEKKAIYCEKNKTKISEKAKEQIICECGSIITLHSRTRHKKSIKHCQFIQSVTFPLVVLT